MKASEYTAKLDELVSLNSVLQAVRNDEFSVDDMREWLSVNGYPTEWEIELGTVSNAWAIKALFKQYLFEEIHRLTKLALAAAHQEVVKLEM